MNKVCIDGAFDIQHTEGSVNQIIKTLLTNSFVILTQKTQVYEKHTPALFRLSCLHALHAVPLKKDLNNANKTAHALKRIKKLRAFSHFTWAEQHHIN